MTLEKITEQSERLLTGQAELARLIALALPHDGAIEPQHGVHFHRNSVSGQRVHAVCEPAFCVMAQGSKLILLGEESFRYDPAHYLISTIELPLIGEIVEASSERPYLGLRLTLDPS